MDGKVIIRERALRRQLPDIANHGIAIEVIRLTLKHKKLLGVMLGISALCCILFTDPFFMPPRYRSETVIYPPSSNTSTSLINSDMRFGSDRDVDNAIQVLSSSLLRDSIVTKYKLMQHYGIDTLSPARFNTLSEQYGDNVSVERTRYNSILIKVYDTDPAFAAAIANDIVKIGDNVKAGIIKKNLYSAYNSVSRELRDKVHEIGKLADSISYLKHKNYLDAMAMRNEHFQSKKKVVSSLRSSIEDLRSKEGVYDLDKQYNSIYTTYLRASAAYLTDSGMVAVMSKSLRETDTALIHRRAEMEGSRILMRDLKEKLSSLNRSGNQYNSLQDNYTFEKSVLSGLEGEYEFSRSTFDKEFGDLSLETMKRKYSAEIELFNNIKAKYELALGNLTDLIPASYVISPAIPSTKKASPHRLIILTLVLLSTYLLGITVLILRKESARLVELVKD